MTRVDRRPMPSLTEIVDHWKGVAPEVFPNIAAARSGWDDPFCFRCGWWPPLDFDFDGDLWTLANGWLERAHLVCKAGGGPNEPFNLVPLCPLCHWAMPPFDDVEPALEWVRRGQPVSRPGMFQALSDATWHRRGLHEYPGRRALFSVFYAAVLSVDAPAILERSA